MSIYITFVKEDGTKFKSPAVPGERLTQVAYQNDVCIQQTCGGAPSCTDCCIKVSKDTPDDAFLPIEHAEKALLGNVFFITRERLACQCIVQKDAIVYVPDAKKMNSFKKKK